MKKFNLLTKTLLVAVLLMVRANAWADVLPTPVYFNDFSSTTDLTIVGNGVFEDDADARFGKIFHNDPTNTSAVRTNYLQLPSDVLSHSATSKEMTIGVWVNKKSEDSFWFSPLFAAYGAAPNNGNTTPMFVCETRGLLQLNNWGWCDFGINDGTPGTSYNDGTPYVSTTWLNDGEWHYYTVVFTTTTAKVYIDGELKNGWTVDGTSNGQVISGLLEHGDALSYITLGGNQAWTWNDADPAFGFDDFAVYDAALSADQIAVIIDDKLNYDYIVNAVDGSDNVLKEIATGKVSKGSSATVYYPQYINVNGTLYSISANGSYPYYGTTFTPDADDYVKKITYTNTGTSVLYFKEGEDLFTNATSTYFASQSKMGYTSNSNSTTYVATTTLPAGTYTIHARFVNSNASTKTTNFRVGSENIVYTYAVAASSQPTVSKEFTITEAGTLYVACEGSSATGIDWFYITGTPAYTVLGDPYYSNWGDYSVNLSDKVTLTPGQSYSYKFVNNNHTAYNWDNYIVPVYDGETLKLAIRADFWENVAGSNSGCAANIVWANFISDMNGATIDMNLTYTSDKYFKMQTNVTTSSSSKWYYNYTSPSALTADEVKVALGANWCWLEVIKESGAIATTNALGYTTFSSINKLDLDNLPTGLKAYYALYKDVSNDYVTLTEATGIVPSETGLILKGEANTVYEIPTSTSDATALSGNLLVACPYRETVTADASKYVLVNNSGTMEFQSLKTNGATIPTGKAYLNVNSGAGARLSILFEDEGVTAIKDMEASYNSGAQTEGKHLENGKIIIVKDGVKFNTNGQKIR